MSRNFTYSSVLALVFVAVACSDDSPDPAGNGGTAGSAGSNNNAAGSAGSAGSAGDGGGGSAGDGGSAGSANAAGSAGSAGSGTTANADLSFFVTSEGSGADGANLGGLDGADARCEEFAAAVGAGAKTWRAYLSTSDVDARDRIGDGPWENANGDVVAANLAELHDASRAINGSPNLMMDETGAPVPGAEHDILTGSTPEGTLLADATCADWTSNVASAPGPQVGHSDIPMNTAFSPSWNSAHAAPGCDQASLDMVGGAGRLYCFAE
jgi:hypothetical protein